jgi:SAM-dependent methyltransferase
MSIRQFANMTWAQAVAFMPNPEVQPVRQRMAELTQGARLVVDLGCGKGDEVGDWFDPETYIGFDCSPHLIAIARELWPGFAFFTKDILELSSPVDVCMLKAVLEHLPETEAVAVYNHARSLCRKLLLVWHTEPRNDVGEYMLYDGELGRMQQNRHRRSVFEGTHISHERIGKHTIWVVRGTAPNHTEVL